MNSPNAQRALSHVDASGNPAMVDVSEKPASLRSASASAKVLLPPAAILHLHENGFMGGKNGSKGQVIHTAIIAGVQAAKRTSELIPFCHLIALQACDISIAANASGFAIECTCRCNAQTGVEMEALTGATAAALCIYDMCKALSFDISITDIRLLQKTGGKSDYGNQP